MTDIQTPILSEYSRRQSLKLMALVAACSALPVQTLLASSRRVEDPILPWSQLPSPIQGYHLFVDLATGGNVLLATHDDQALLIDTKFASLGLALRADAMALNNGNPDLTLINTHHHGDHTGGNAFVLPHAKHSYAQTNAVERIKGQIEQSIQQAESGPDELMKNNASKAMIVSAQRAAGMTGRITADSVSPKDTVEKHADIKHGGSTVSMHHFGAGHTDNDLVVHFENDNIIHTGDLVFNGLHPFFFPSHGATAIGWIKSLKATYALTDKDTQVIPGHGQPGDRSIIQKQIDYHTQLIEHVQRAIDSGSSKEEAASMEWDFMAGLGFESIRPRAISAVYDELKS